MRPKSANYSDRTGNRGRALPAALIVVGAGAVLIVALLLNLLEWPYALESLARLAETGGSAAATAVAIIVAWLIGSFVVFGLTAKNVLQVESESRSGDPHAIRGFLWSAFAATATSFFPAAVVALSTHGANHAYATIVPLGVVAGIALALLIAATVTTLLHLFNS